MEVHTYQLHLSRIREQTLHIIIADNVWNAAIRRYLPKANTLTYRVGDLTRRAEANLHELKVV